MAHPPQPQPDQGTNETAHGRFAAQLIDLIETLFSVMLADLDDQDVFQVGQNHILPRSAEK